MTVEAGAFRDKMGERLAWAQIIMGSAVTAYGQLATGINAATIGLSFFFLILQWGMSYRGWQARLLFRRGQGVTACLNIGAMLVAGWFVHAALLQGLEMAERADLLVGYDAEMLASAMILLPFLEPLGFWSHALLREPQAAPAAPVAKGRPDLRVVGKGAVAVGAAGVAVAPGGSALAAPEMHRAPATERGQVTRQHDGAPPEKDLAVALWDAGERNVSKIARDVGRPRTTVQKWLPKAA